MFIYVYLLNVYIYLLLSSPRPYSTAYHVSYEVTFKCFLLTCGEGMKTVVVVGCGLDCFNL